MTFGKIIAYNPETHFGIIEDRLGDRYRFHSKDVVEDSAVLKTGSEVAFEWFEIRDFSTGLWTLEAYYIESNSGQFARHHEVFGRYM